MITLEDIAWNTSVGFIFTAAGLLIIIFTILSLHDKIDKLLPPK
jgi:hypothetical protein